MLCHSQRSHFCLLHHRRRVYSTSAISPAPALTPAPAPVVLVAARPKGFRGQEHATRHATHTRRHLRVRTKKQQPLLLLQLCSLPNTGYTEISHQELDQECAEGQLVAGTAQPAGGNRRWPTARGERAGGGRWGIGTH